MKKYIIGLSLMAIVLIAPVAQAATIEDVQSLQTEYQSALVTIIGLLQQQVEGLLKQLAILQESQNTLQNQTSTIATAVAQIQQNTTPITPEIIVGSVSEPTVVPLVCTISTEGDVTATASNNWVKLVWTSNGDGGKIYGNHTAEVYSIGSDRIASGIQMFQISSETGELNTITLHVIGSINEHTQGEVTDCTTQVLTL